ncbi:MAG: hypothetical protein JNK95_16845 [Candidatus Competibacter sp.]|nr:hypothetical protein [Candidatus Competibacter sp.]HRD50563.1 hypothetical protein [Candidatus Contendobacter sp.]
MPPLGGLIVPFRELLYFTGEIILMISENHDQHTSQDLIHLERRFDDLKWYIGIMLGVITILFAGFTVFVGLNFSAEKTSLKEYKDSTKEELKEAIGISNAKPLLSLQTIDRRPLDGATITADYSRSDDGKLWVSFIYVLRNEGNGRSGPIFQKIYSTDLKFENSEIDGTGFKYETFVKPESFNPSDLFGGASMSYKLRFQILEEPAPIDQVKSVFVVYFYGNGQKSQAHIRISIKK